MSIIDRVALIKERQVKQNFQKWFDVETVDEMINYLKSSKTQNYTLTKVFIIRKI